MRLLIIGMAIMAGVLIAAAQSQSPTEQQLLGSTIGDLFVANTKLAVELQKAQAQLQAIKAEKSCKE